MIKDNVYAQTDTSFKLVKTITAEVSHLAVDNLENIYLITSNGQLKKLSATGDSLAVYNSTKRYGSLHSVDVSNPLKLILFHKDFSTIVILDRMLAERGSIDLRRKGIIQVSAVSTSYDNNIWIFDEYENKLKKIDESGNVLLETADLRNSFNLSLVPDQIIDYNGLVYLYDAANGLFVFDNYGSFKRKIPVINWKHIYINDRYIAGIFNNTVSFYNTTTLQQYQHILPASFHHFTNYIIANTKLFATSKNLINIYMLDF